MAVCACSHSVLGHRRCFEPLPVAASILPAQRRSRKYAPDGPGSQERNAAVIGMHLACHTQEEIAEAVGMPQNTVHSILSKTEDFRFVVKPGEMADIEDDKERLAAIQKANRAAAEHAIDFDVPLYTNKTGRHGRGKPNRGVPQRWRDRQAAHTMED